MIALVYFQPRFRINSHLAEVRPISLFPRFEFIHDDEIDSGPEFFCNLPLLLDVIGSQDFLLLQDREGFKDDINPRLIAASAL